MLAGLHLDDDSVVHHHVERLTRERFSAVKDHDRDLPFDAEAHCEQLTVQCQAVDMLSIPEAQGSMHSSEAANNGSGRFSFQEI